MALTELQVKNAKAPEAKTAWIAFHDAIEGKLASGGELFDVRDVASKSADNAARLAALFYVFEGGLGAISADAFERASRIAAWHLNESRRFFGELALPAEMADAVPLALQTLRTNQCHHYDQPKVNIVVPAIYPHRLWL